MTRSSPTRKASPSPKLSERLGGLIVVLSTFTIVGLAIADFVNDGKVDRLWIGALLVLALTFGGYGADKMLGRWFGP
jgi:hypothetical protein